MSTVQVTEDTTYVFKTTDFTTGTLTGIQITSLPTTGTLMLNGVPVTLNQGIRATDISAGHFTFVPNTDVTVTGSFTDIVGTTTSTTSSTVTLNIAPDAGPSALASSITATENQTYTLKLSDFGYSDTTDKTADPLGSVIITSLPSDGTLQLNGNAVTVNQSITAAQISGGQLIFVPTTNVTTAGSFSFKVTDSLGGTTSATAATMSISITGGTTTTDTGPTALASSVQVTEDVTYPFKVSDFGYSDSFDPGDPLKSITIVSLPTTGTLELNGTGGAVAVTAGQVIAAGSIPNLIFVPNTDVVTTGLFQFEVTDTTGGITSAAATMSVNVTPDAGPSALAGSITATENQTYTLKVSDFGYSDTADKTADPLGSVIITSLPSDGTLKLNGNVVTVNQSITAAQISGGQLTFVPTANVTTSGSFTFKVTDSLGGTTSATAATMSITITTGTDTGPTALASSVQVTEDVSYSFKVSDFGYSDSFDPGDPLRSVTINSLPTTGTLQLSGSNVTVGQVITAANITNLTFVPNTDVTAAGSFSFSVTDTTGGFTSGGATMSVNVTPDAGPSALASSITATKNLTYTFKVSDFGYSDTADKTADPLGSVVITTLPGDGTLKLNNIAVTANQSITAAQISGGQLTFVPTTNVTTAGSFSFKVTDTAAGGTSATSATAATMSISIGVPGATPAPQLSFAAQNFNTVGADNGGFYQIPPDSNAAVGLSTVITATNGVLEAFNKSGTALNIFGGSNNESLNTFFSAGLGSLVLTNFNDPNQSGPFDPKVIYDPFTNRFIVVALQESDAGGPFNDTNSSNILIAVSSPDNGSALTWSYTSINSDVIANGLDSWADFPGLSVDGSGNIYVTANLFSHATGTYQGSRLWTISEADIVSGAATNNATAAGKANIYDPSVLSGATAAGPNELFTLMPAQMLPGSGAFASPLGTYLVSYDGAQNSQGEVLNVIQVIPQASGSPTFTYSQINLGNIDSGGAFASFTAPQKGTRKTIDAGDDRIYSVAFRNGYLYAATTVLSPSTGLTTAHWFQVGVTQTSATTPATLNLLNQGDVSGASIGTGVRTFYPAITVDANGDFAIGFSASGSGIFTSAYYEAFKFNASTTTWTAETPTLLAAGQASYVRTFGGGDNRWGDFSSIVPDPSNPSTFWVYNEFAWTQGTTINGENGRWATQVGEFSLPNTITGPVVASSGSTGSSQTTASTTPSTSNPNFGQPAQVGTHGVKLTSDVDPNANPLVEGDHGPAIGALPSLGHGFGALASQLAGSFSQLVQTMAAFGPSHLGIPSVGGTNPSGPTDAAVLAANLFHHHG